MQSPTSPVSSQAPEAHNGCISSPTEVYPVYNQESFCQAFPTPGYGQPLPSAPPLPSTNLSHISPLPFQPEPYPRQPYYPDPGCFMNPNEGAAIPNGYACQALRPSDHSNTPTNTTEEWQHGAIAMNPWQNQSSAVPSSQYPVPSSTTSTPVYGRPDRVTDDGRPSLPSNFYPDLNAAPHMSHSTQDHAQAFSAYPEIPHSSRPEAMQAASTHPAAFVPGALLLIICCLQQY